MNQKLTITPSSIQAEGEFVEILGHKIHYVQEGSGDPILFIHGNPTSSFVYRNVLKPIAEKTGRKCIAFDLIGFGKSDKPKNIDYTPQLFTEIIDGFIQSLKLEKIILVAEDWGGFFGGYVMAKNKSSFQAAIFMETFLWPMTWKEDFDPKFVIPFKIMRSPVGFIFSQVMNIMVNKMIPEHCPISDEALQQYKDFMPTIADRKAMGTLPKLIPLNEKPKESYDMALELQNSLKNISFPILWIKANPGVMISNANPCGMRRLEELQNILPQMEIHDFGEGNHFLSEENPKKLVAIINSWITKKL